MNDGPTEEHREDLDPLLDYLLPFAVQMIEKHGEFYPFGAIVRQDGQIASVGAVPDSEQPDTHQVLDLLQTAIHEGFVSGIRAAAICMDVRVQLGSDAITDAIRVWMQHSAGEPLDVFMPYEKRRLRSPRFGDLQAVPADAPLFPADP